MKKAILLLPFLSMSVFSGTFEAKRAEMLNRPRTVIWNTDGNDMVLYPRSLPLTQEAFESVRLKYTEGTKIDSVFYCPHCSAFGWFTTRKTHDFMTAQFRPPEAEVYNAAEDFAKKGTDALEMALRHRPATSRWIAGISSMCRIRWALLSCSGKVAAP